MRVGGTGAGDLREGVESPSLEVFQIQQDTALSIPL